MCLGCLDALFYDKRVITGVLMFYLTLVLVTMKEIGLLDSNFMNVGPSENTSFMGVKLNTWYKWNLVAAFTFINTSVNDFMSDAISPWILNTITDHKTKYLPYSKTTCIVISQMWSVYCNVMSVFGLFLAMTQVDFVMIRMVADLTVNVYTNLRFMQDKVTCCDRYKRDLESELSVLNPGSSSENLGADSDRAIFSIEELQGK